MRVESEYGAGGELVDGDGAQKEEKILFLKYIFYKNEKRNQLKGSEGYV